MSNLLGLKTEDVKTNKRNYSKIEYHFTKMLAGHPESIERAKNLLKTSNIQASMASLKILAFSGIHPVGVMALRMVSREVHEIVVPGGPSANMEVDLYLNDQPKFTKFGFTMDLNERVHWTDWGYPNLLIRDQSILPESLIVAAKGRLLKDVIHHPAFDETLVIESISSGDKGETRIYFDHKDGLKDIDWILNQDYGLMSWGIDLDERFTLIEYISSQNINPEKLINLATKMEMKQKL